MKTPRLGWRFVAASALSMSLFIAARPAEGTRAAPEVERGRRIYHRACAPCHGGDGRGDGPTARALDIAPRNLTLGVYRFRTTASGALPTDADLARTVRYGIPGTDMPAWGQVLPERDIDAAVAYIKTFSARFTAEAPGQPVTFPAGVADSDAAREQGRALYAKMQCASCHGEGGRGDGPSMPGLRDEEGRSLPAADLTRPEYKGGWKPQDVERAILTGLDGAAMPSYASALTPDEVSALARYVLSLRRERGLLGWLTETVR